MALLSGWLFAKNCVLDNCVLDILLGLPCYIRTVDEWLTWDSV